MVKGFHYVGSTILGYRLVLVKDSGRKGNFMLDSKMSNKNYVLKPYSKTPAYKGKK